MIQNHATLNEIRFHLQKKVSEIYSPGESSALVKLIMEHCGYPSPKALLNPFHQPGPAIVAQINEIVSEIHTHRPIQYILGETIFCELLIRINEKALIPRPETEEMVYEIFKKQLASPERIIDLGTGSGCIALALKKNFPDALTTGLDISAQALELAQINADHNQLDVDWIQGDILSGESIPKQKNFDLIVSNPPYVLNQEKSLMDHNVLDFEPHGALFVEDSDPLIFYSAIARLSAKILTPRGCVWLEINERFGAEVASLMSAEGFTHTSIHKDIHEKERFIEARF